jgi:hypothetical protein
MLEGYVPTGTVTKERRVEFLERPLKRRSEDYIALESFIESRFKN